MVFGEKVIAFASTMVFEKWWVLLLLLSDRLGQVGECYIESSSRMTSTATDW